MKFASSSLCTSLAIALSLSWAKTLFFCQNGGKDGHTLSLWTMIFGLIPGMLLWLQAKTSQFFFRKRASSLQIEGSACIPIQVIQPRMLSSKEISSRSSIGFTIPFFIWFLKPTSDHPSPAWRCSIWGRLFGALVLLLSHTPPRTLLAGGMWMLLLSMH